MTAEIIKTVVQILFLASFMYYFYVTLAQNTSTHLIKSVLGYVLVYVVSAIAKLTVLESVLRTFAVPAAVFFCILYQPELRRAFSVGLSVRRRFFGIRGGQTSSDNLDSVMNAVQRLVQSKRGALIVFPRQVSLKNIADTGTKINADISSALIVTVFDHDTPLHDGAMIIQGPKIVAAGCYLPLSAQTDIQQSFGTRHRAGLGMAEESDAIVLIVSEETRAISLAYNGKLFYDLEPEYVKTTLFSLLNNIEIDVDSSERNNDER